MSARSKLGLKLALGAGLLLIAGCQPTAPAPDAIFIGAIHTGIDGAPAAEAVSVRDGRILEVGERASIMASAGDATRVHDLGGGHLYPGFTDAHVHLRGVGERELTLNLDKVASIAELVETVKTAHAALPEGRILVGRGWIETHWPEKRFPTRQDIDAVTGDRPVILTRADGHALLANTATLKAVGLDGANPAQPAGGRIETDAQGLPTGMLIDNAMGAIAPLAAESEGPPAEEALAKGADVYASRGWTGAHNMSVSAADVPVMNSLSDAARLPLRVYNAVDGGEAGDFPAEVFGQSANGLVTTRAIKLYMDGALGSRGALLSAPYSDRPDTSGLQLSKEEETLALMKRAYDAGIKVCMHAIGDRGNTLVLDWMEKTFATVPEAERAARDPRWRIEHSQILAVADIPRFAQLGVVPSMQPSHAIGDLYFAPSRLGPDRLGGAYAWRALIDAGSIIAGGSDAPVEQGDPRIEFYAAVARKDLKGASGPDWHPEQAVSRGEALKMFTLWPAQSIGREAELGTIEPGKLADFTGFSGDILAVPEADILTVDPVITVIGGNVVWEKGAVS
jgi:predicted amidohydrolase YtcJ